MNRSTLLYRLGRLVRCRPPEDVTLIASALVVGAGAGLGAVVFIELLHRVGVLTGRLTTIIGTAVALIAIMAVAGVVVGFVVERWAAEAKGHGVPDVMEAVALRGGHIRPRVVVIKMLASALTIGTGGSAGREGPIVQVGAALGSTVGQFLHFSDERLRTLVACGAAGGIAATFNAPIAGALFALEVVLGSFTAHNFGAVVISSVAAAVVSHALLGASPAFVVPAYPFTHVAELPIYALVGGLAGAVAVAFTRTLYWVEDRFDGWSVPAPFRYGLGMALTAAVGLALPDGQVLGPGLAAIGDTIAANFAVSLPLMAALLVGKLAATSLTLGSGNSGGVFAPSLFLGATLGGLVGTVAHGVWPGVAANPGAYALVGMAALFAGAAHAPITAVLIVFEMSHDYNLILPLMLATVLSTFVAQALFPDSIYTSKLRRKGIRLHAGRDVDLLEAVTVAEVMTHDVPTIDTGLTLPELSEQFSHTHHHSLIVVADDGRVWGIVTVTDLDRAVAKNRAPATPVTAVGTPRSQLTVTHPDETIAEALAHLGAHDVGSLPVLSREEPDRLVGVIRREEILHAYTKALSRRGELQHRVRRAQARNLPGMEFVDLTLMGDDQAVGKTLQELASALPEECIVVSLQRDGRVLVPHGTTTFQSGDRITVFGRSSDRDRLQYAIYGTVGARGDEAGTLSRPGGE